MSKKLIKTGGGMTREPRKPVFMCAGHREPVAMLYDAGLMRWVCPLEGCVQTRQPMSGDDTSMLRHPPKLVIVVDEDGDEVAHLYWAEYRLMYPIDFKRTKLFSGPDGGTYLRWDYEKENTLRVDSNGKEID